MAEGTDGGAREATGARGTMGGELQHWSGRQPVEQARSTAGLAGGGGERERRDREPEREKVSARDSCGGHTLESMLGVRIHGAEVGAKICGAELGAKICGAELGAMCSGAEVPTT